MFVLEVFDSKWLPNVGDEAVALFLQLQEDEESDFGEEDDCEDEFDPSWVFLPRDSDEICGFYVWMRIMCAVTVSLDLQDKKKEFKIPFISYIGCVTENSLF